MKTVIRILVLTLLLLIALLLVVVATPLGSRITVERGSALVSGLNVEGVTGTLWSSLEISNLQYLKDGTAVDAQSVLFAWRPACLLDRRVCVNELSADVLNVSLPAGQKAVDDAKRETITLPELSLPVGFRAERLHIGVLNLKVDQSSFKLRDIELSGVVDQDSVSLSSLSFGWAAEGLSGQFGATGSVTLAGEYPVNLDVTLNTDAAQVGALELPTSALDLRLSDTLEFLRVDAKLDGGVAATLSGYVEPLVVPAGVDLHFASESLQWPLTGDPLVALADTVVSASGNEESLMVSVDSEVNGAEIPQSTVHLGGLAVPRTGLSDGNFKIDTLGGALSGDATVKWVDGVAVNLVALLDSIQPEALVPDLNGHVSGRVALDVSLADQLVIEMLNLDLNGELREQSVGLNGTASMRDNTLRVGADGLRFQFGDNTADVVGSAGDVLDMTSTLNFPDLSQMLSTLNGSAAGTLTLSGSRTLPSVAATLTARDVHTGAASVQGVSLEGDLLEGGEVPSLGVLSWQGLNLGTREIGNGELTLEGVRSAHRAALQVTDSPVSAQLVVEGALAGLDWAGALQKGQIDAGGRRWLSDPNVALTVQQDAVGIAAHCWASAPAKLCLASDAQVASTGNAGLTAERVPVEWISALVPTDLSMQGWLDGQLNAEWVAGALPTVSGEVKASDLSVDVPSSTGEVVSLALGGVSVVASSRRNPSGADTVVADINTGGGALGSADINVRVPLDDVQAFSGDIQWQDLQLESVAALAPDLDRLAGELSVDTQVRGGDGGPVFDGVVRLRDGVIQGLDLPTELFAASLDVQLVGQRADIHGGWRSAVNAAEQNVSVSGQADWQRGPAFSAAIVGREVPVDYRPWVRASIAPDLRIEASESRISVRGSVSIPKADIEIVAPELRAPTPSGDTVMIDADSSSSEQEKSGPALNVDVAVNIADEVYLAGFGFDSRLKGDVDIRLTPTQPLQLYGNLSILDGRYEAWGQNLVIDRGELVFAGPPAGAAVDATAWRELPTVRAGLSISGQVAAPDVTVISEPAMPDQEALSYLLLGRAWDEAGDRQAAITRAALSLGLKRSGGLTDRVASGLGIKSLSVEAQGSGTDTAAVVNAQLNEKLSVQYGVGVFTPFRTLTARYQLGQQLYVEAVQGVESALDFFYSFEF